MTIDILWVAARVALAVTRAIPAMYVFASAEMIINSGQNKNARPSELLLQYDKKGLTIDVDANAEKLFVEQFRARGAGRNLPMS